MAKKIQFSKEVQVENKKIRTLRFMVELTIALIYQGEITREEALERVEGVRHYALKLFPGKENAFELLYAPKFKRVIREVYGFH